MYVAKVWASEHAVPDIVECPTLARVDELMDTYLAVGWWRIDWRIDGRFVATVRYNERDPLNPLILEALTC